MKTISFSFPILLLSFLLRLNTILYGQSEAPNRDAESTMRTLWTPDRAQYITEWLLLGKIPAKWNVDIDNDFLSNSGGESVIRPIEGQIVKLDNGTELKWIKLQNSTKIVRLAEIFKSVQIPEPIENIVYYAYGKINRNSAGRALLTVGSDDLVKVWLNGKLIHRNTEYRSMAVDQDLIEVEFNEGDNYLLYKFSQTAWGRTFTTRVTEDSNIPENTVQTLRLRLTDHPANSSFTLWSAPLVNTLTKQQPVHIQIYTYGGNPVFEKTILRGDTVSLNYADWNDGVYEIKYTYNGLNDLFITNYLSWFKGDILKFAKQMVKSAPDQKEQTIEAITHRMLSDFINYRLEGNFRDADDYRKTLLHPLLMEFNELKLNRQVRPGGFLRLAYIDDIDGTPQFCRCYIPWDYDPAKKSALVVFLHGFNGENPDYVRWWYADKRHDMYTDRYNFILIEPHGRGNTQYTGIGDKDVMKCIELAKEKLNVDNDRIYLTGASMGGGGTWRVASVHPELFAAIAPVFGGWDYRNFMPWEYLDHVSPKEGFLFDKKYTTCQFESLLHMPILALHGDSDNMVDISNTRYLVRMLERWSYNVRYIEVPGKGHEDLEKGDIIYPWLLQHTRTINPKQVRIRSADLRTASAYWIQITQRNSGWEMINAEAEILSGNIIRVNSENVLEMVLSPDPSLLQKDQPVNVIWNGEILTFDGHSDTYTLRNKTLGSQPMHKSPELAGTFNDFINTPFAIVVGTTSKDSLMQTLIELKTEVFKKYWKYWQRFDPRIIKDTEITDDELNKYSLFLIGGPNENKISRRISKMIPFQITASSISIEDTTFQSPDAFLEVIYPSPFNQKRYIRLVAPTSYAGMYFYDPLAYLDSNLDYVIQDGVSQENHREGPSWIAAGQFNHDWRLDRSYLEHADSHIRAKSSRITVDRNLGTSLVKGSNP